MDRIKGFGGFDRPLPFSVSFSDPEARLHFSLVDSAADAVLFLVEFDKQAGTISLKDRRDGTWSKAVLHEAPLKGAFMRGEIAYEDGRFRLKFKDYVLDLTGPVPELTGAWSLFSNFAQLNLGSDEPILSAQANRWRFLPLDRLRDGDGSKLRALSASAERPAGLTGLYLWDGDEAALAGKMERVGECFDELMVVIHDSSHYRSRFFAELQSRFFNLKACLVETVVKANGEVRKLKGALFLDKVLSQARYRNVLFVNSSMDEEALKRMVPAHRLRSRSDDFLLVDETAQNRIQALSLGPLTHFADIDGKAHLEPADLALRLSVHARSAAPSASLEWDIADVGVSDVRLTVHDRQKKMKVKARAKLVVMVISCKKNRHRQQAIRDTWAKDARAANIEICFVEGHASQEEAALVDDRLILPCPDTYEYLSHKIWHAFKAAPQIFDADHFMKLDDDCLLNPHKLLEFRYEDFDYIGSDINVGSRTALDWHHSAVANRQLADLIFELDAEQTWFDGQGGYILSRRAAAALASMPLADYQHMLEDYATGRAMKAAGWPAVRLSSALISVRDIYIKEDRDYDNAVIGDIAGVERMFEVHEIVTSRNREVLDGKGRWRFEFPKP